MSPRGLGDHSAAEARLAVVELGDQCLAVAREDVGDLGSRQQLQFGGQAVERIGPRLGARPDIATAGNAAAATTKPANSPQTSKDAALASSPWSRLRIQVTASGYVTPQRAASWRDAPSLT